MRTRRNATTPAVEAPMTDEQKADLARMTAEREKAIAAAQNAALERSLAAKALVEAAPAIAPDPRQVGMFQEPEAPKPPPIAPVAFGNGFFGGGKTEDASNATGPAPRPSDVTQNVQGSAFRFKAEVDAVEIAKRAAGDLFIRSDSEDEGGVVLKIAVGEESYGRPGTFSSFRVPELSITTKLPPGRRVDEFVREVRGQLRALQAEERDAKTKEFFAHWKQHFG